MTVALYAGSFDPFTLGHLSMLGDATALFDRVIVAVGAHPSRNAMFEPTERLKLVEACIAEAGLGARADARQFDGLVVDAARAWSADALVRGVRDGTDLDYELQMVGMNRAMAPDLPTVILPPSASTRHVTGTLVRQIASMGGDVSPFVPPATLAALAARTM